MRLIIHRDSGHTFKKAPSGLVFIFVIGFNPMCFFNANNVALVSSGP